jgi:hypothetical protein
MFMRQRLPYPLLKAGGRAIDCCEENALYLWAPIFESGQSRLKAGCSQDWLPHFFTTVILGNLRVQKLAPYSASPAGPFF